MLRFAYTALLEGHKINIFLVEDGVFVGKKSQDPKNYDNVGKWMKDVIEEGANIKACGVCTKARGVSAEELIEGIEITTMNGFLEMCVSANNILYRVFYQSKSYERTERNTNLSQINRA